MAQSIDKPLFFQRWFIRAYNDRKKVELNCKALHILFWALGPDVYAKVFSCESAKKVWDRIEVIHEGTNDVKETKIGLLNLEYENFKMNPKEEIKGMFNRFSTVVNQLKGFRKEILEDKLVRNLIYSLPESWIARIQLPLKLKMLGPTAQNMAQRKKKTTIPPEIHA
ncbi:hypothetical protein GQ457_10G006140 [Hibiscus cannabinus]